jgi:hypothetical protein
MCSPYTDNSSRQSDPDRHRQRLDWDGERFTLDGAAVEIKLRPGGMRVGCHFATDAAVRKLYELLGLSQFT